MATKGRLTLPTYLIVYWPGILPMMCSRRLDDFIYSNSGSRSIGCSYKAATGSLYPLERGFIFLYKPPMHIRFDEISNVNFARSVGNTRSFDFDVETKTGVVFTFVGIEK